eukprot:CAMPEP_0176068490 /NCGR_PEP_ID=MMETSP0120_2-20121206/34189_1 /TAXON_ID=160619 /ORGANISM="Kryptoperidinium foliaceum, Strain CCMP 1326" /LENGTH=64 /DNA_ID=CAMNT_0017402111 /DNA_START=726 /DNA_END=920 /DNA_ORIENTATION=+
MAWSHAAPAVIVIAEDPEPLDPVDAWPSVYLLKHLLELLGVGRLPIRVAARAFQARPIKVVADI